MRPRNPPSGGYPKGSLQYWFTRAQAGKVLGVTAAAVKAIQLRGQLRSTKDEQGIHRYNPAEVHELALRRAARKNRREVGDNRLPPTSGALEARVFELIDLYWLGGERDALKIKRTIVREVGITGEEFARYWEDYNLDPDEQTRAKRRAELQAAHEVREKAKAELRVRLEIERLRAEREENRRDAEFQKELRRIGPRRPKPLKPPEVAALEAALGMEKPDGDGDGEEDKRE